MSKKSTAVSLRLFACACLPLLIGACASISVKKGAEVATPQSPAIIYVANFSTSGGHFNVDRDGAELTQFKQNLQNILQAGQVADLKNRLVNAAPAPLDAWNRHERAWLVTGTFVRVNQGSRLLRTAIGFGAGGTKMVTRVRVYDLSLVDRNPFLSFTTTGGSNAEPGAVTSFATDPLDLAVQIALSGVSGFSHGVTEDAKRTAREITAELSDYEYRSGWISKDKWIVPKDVAPGDEIE